MNVETLTELLGWCTVINFGLMILTAVILIPFRDPLSRLHAKIFGLDEVFVKQSYFGYLKNYKIAVIVLNFVPFIALKVMAGA